MARIDCGSQVCVIVKYLNSEIIINSELIINHKKMMNSKNLIKMCELIFSEDILSR